MAVPLQMARCFVFMYDKNNSVAIQRVTRSTATTRQHKLVILIKSATSDFLSPATVPNCYIEILLLIQSWCTGVYLLILLLKRK